MITIII